MTKISLIMNNGTFKQVVKSSTLGIAVVAAVAIPTSLVSTGHYDLVYGASGGDVGFWGSLAVGGAADASAALTIASAAEFGIGAAVAGPAGWIAGALVVGL